jgi:hypothetical protein
MGIAWTITALTARRHGQEVMVIGTDPVLGVLTALPWRAIRRRCGIIHWCHDLYPEAPIADGMVRESSLAIRILKRLLAAAYRQCDLLADLGPCMRRRLARYNVPTKSVTLTPWALVESSGHVETNPLIRRELFGDARLGLLYSGNFGRAHSYSEFLDLARAVREDSIQLCFAGRGNRMDEMKQAVKAEDTNVTFAGFAPESELEKRLGACDLHLVSLRPEWTGTVVPSKFFGGLASGRGIIFAGSPDSAIAQWIKTYGVGWILTNETLPQVSAELRHLAANPAELIALRTRCHAVYQTHFSRNRQLNLWDEQMRALLR